MPKSGQKKYATPGVGAALTAYLKSYVQLTGIFRGNMARLARFYAALAHLTCEFTPIRYDTETAPEQRIVEQSRRGPHSQLPSSMHQPEVIFGNGDEALGVDRLA